MLMQGVKSKKAEMGVGTLIIFIAFILVAAIAGGVLIQTAISLQQRALTVGDEAERNIATHVDVIMIEGEDGTDGYLNNFTIQVRLSAGSDPIKLSDSVIAVTTKTKSASLEYRGTNNALIQNNSGFNTFSIEEVNVIVSNITNNFTLNDDLDDDGKNDYLYVYDSNTIRFNLSSIGAVDIDLDSGDFNTSGGNPRMNGKILTSGGVDYATVSISGGAISTNHSLPATANFSITTALAGKGYYSVEYMNRGPSYTLGYMHPGDTLKMYFESSENVTETQKMRVIFIPKAGSQTNIEFRLPDVVTEQKIYLYP